MRRSLFFAILPSFILAGYGNFTLPWIGDEAATGTLSISIQNTASMVIAYYLPLRVVSNIQIDD